MAYAFRAGGLWQEIAGAFVLGEGDDAITYPEGWTQLASPEELAAIGVVSIIEPPAPAPGVLVTGSELVDVAGVPTRQLSTAPMDLADARAQVWARAKAYRDQRIGGGCATPAGRVQTDTVSQGRIGNAALAAFIKKAGGEPFAVDWTMEDDSIVTLDADGMIAMGFAVMSYVAGCQNAGTAIRVTIDAAASAAAVQAIDIQAGYPA